MVKTRDAIRAGTTDALSSAAHGGNVLENVAVGVGTNALSANLIPTSTAPTNKLTAQQAQVEVQKSLARTALVSTVAAKIQVQDLGNALVASGVGVTATMAGNATGNTVNKVMDSTKPKAAVVKPPPIPPRSYRVNLNQEQDISPKNVFVPKNVNSDAAKAVPATNKKPTKLDFKPELVTPQIDKRISKFNLAANAGLPPEPGFSAVKNLWQEREKSKVSTNFDQTFPQPTKSEALSASHKNKTVKPASLMKQALDIMVPAAHASELPDVESKQSSMQQMRAKLEQDFREADDFFAPLVPQQEQDANISSVKDFMSSPESYHNNHSEPTVLDALLYAAGRGTGGMQSIAKDAEVLVDPFGFQEAIRTGNITSHMQRAQNLSDGIAVTYETVRKDGLLPIFNSRVQHYQNQMSAARNQAERGNFFGAGYTSGEAQMDVAKDALALTGLGYGAAGLGRLAGRQAMNQGKLLYQMGTMGVEQGRAAFALADGLNAPFLGRGYSAPIDRAARGFDLSRPAPHELFPPQAGRPDAVGQPLLHKFKPLDHNGKPLKTGLRIYQEGREVVTYAQRNDANLVGKNVGNPILNQFKYKTTNVKTSDLQPTHGINYSKKAFEKFVAKIKTEGIQEPVRYVVHGGVKHIVDGHHRLFAARELNLPNIPAVEVKLPYKGYKTVNDLVFGL